MTNTEEICHVVRGSMGGGPWGWDVIDARNGEKLHHTGTQADAESWADGYAAGVITGRQENEDSWIGGSN